MSPRKLRRDREMSQSTFIKENTRRRYSLNLSDKKDSENLIKNKNLSKTRKTKSFIRKKESNKSKNKSQFSPKSEVFQTMDSEANKDFINENKAVEFSTNSNDTVLLNQTVTPASSPIVVNLTPHRCTKTPKKSPVNMTSPKTISKVQMKGWKTPRKLLSLNSSNTLEELNKTLDSKIPKRNEKVKKISKSPKIVLRTPKSKARKHKVSSTNKRKGSASLMLKKSLRHNSSPTEPSKVMSSPTKEDSGWSLNEINHKSKNSVMSVKDVKWLNPVVLLERNVLVDNVKQFSSLYENSKNDIQRYDLRTSIKNIKGETLLSPQKEQINKPKKLLSSSPKEKECSEINTSLNLSSQSNNLQCKEELNTSKEEKESVLNETYELCEPKTPQVRLKSRRQKSLKNVENNEIKEDKKMQKVRFTSSKSNEKEFSAIQSNNTKSVNCLHKTRNCGTPASTRTKSSLRFSCKRSNSFSNESTTRNDSTRRSSSLSNVTMRNHKDADKLEKSVSTKLNKLHDIASQKKDDLKKAPARQIPDFTQIHKDLFSNMESVVDKKKRLEERHKALTTGNFTSKLPTKDVKKYLSTKVNKDGLNRYGFKLHKKEATELVTKKQKPVSSSTRKREENRVLLKGVRTNRRFELQMKSRNIPMV